MKENKDDKKPISGEGIELYSRESSSDMLGDMPNWLIHTGSYIVYGLIAVLLVGSCVFKYPDIVTTNVSIDDYSKTDWIMANEDGIIDEFFVSDGDKVKKNDTLGLIRNTASLDDVKRFCKVLTRVEWFYRTEDLSYLEEYPFDLIMGEMSSSYEQFTEAVRANVFAMKYNAYNHRRSYMQQELKILMKDSVKNELAILNAKRNLFEMELEHKQVTVQNKRLLELAYERMVNSLKSWENRYLIKSTNDGSVLLGKGWSINNRVSVGDTICSVISEYKGHPKGHIKLSQHQVADIAIGDKVNIELSKFPSHTYGYLLGEVSSVSYVPSNKTYAVEVELPDGMYTTSKLEVDYEVGLVGKAEIITSSRSILSRIFGQIINF
ncbi:MAG: HlyD family efflux transporter periplasmic adaptor subunit [Bacteroides sp.]|nr:HlyD family efflux transporter periplasmic adaptor subunit [Bacteroides sp.]